MAEFKLVISTKDGKSEQKEVKDDQAKPFIGKKIGDLVKGDSFGMPGFEFVVSGGSDNCGFPMRKDITGTGRKRILAVKGVGIKKKRKGQRQRKTVCGNTVHGRIAQINLKVTKQGKVEKVDSKEGKPVSDAPKEAPKQESKESSKQEKKEDKSEGSKGEEKEVPTDPKEQKPAEQRKEKPEQEKEEKSKADKPLEKPEQEKAERPKVEKAEEKSAEEKKEEPKVEKAQEEPKVEKKEEPQKEPK